MAWKEHGVKKAAGAYLSSLSPDLGIRRLAMLLRISLPPHPRHISNPQLQRGWHVTHLRSRELWAVMYICSEVGRCIGGVLERTCCLASTARWILNLATFSAAAFFMCFFALTSFAAFFTANAASRSSYSCAFRSLTAACSTFFVASSAERSRITALRWRSAASVRWVDCSCRTMKRSRSSSCCCTTRSRDSCSSRALRALRYCRSRTRARVFACSRESMDDSRLCFFSYSVCLALASHSCRAGARGSAAVAERGLLRRQRSPP